MKSFFKHFQISTNAYQVRAHLEARALMESVNTNVYVRLCDSGHIVKKSKVDSLLLNLAYLTGELSHQGTPGSTNVKFARARREKSRA